MRDDNDTLRFPPTNCLNCNLELDSLSTLDNTVPHPKRGDPVVCLHCGAVATFDNGRVRPLTKQEIEDLMCSTRTMEKLLMIRAGIFFVHHQQAQRN
ncbi:MAG TPA: hypothetical protein VK789_28425 [Bryobacteraceae bacterium]|jgi:hypothetical protein|nr:hypothetical protein [Bryobacteraceae bacterium]